MKSILIINGHPDKESYNHALAEAYLQSAIDNNPNQEISKINIGELSFNPSLEYGYRKRTELEPDLIDAVKKLKEADHIVWFFPTWWQGYPAIMKGFIDRTFLPGIAYEFEKGKQLPKKLFKGKTARIVTTSDTPLWYNYLVLKRPAINQLKKGTLQFCGISHIKVTQISVVKGSSEIFRKKWLNKIAFLGKNLR